MNRKGIAAILVVGAATLVTSCFLAIIGGAMIVHCITGRSHAAPLASNATLNLNSDGGSLIKH